MIVTKGISPYNLVKWSWHYVLWLGLYMGGIAWLYTSDRVSVHIPWLPMSVLGTAVAFYLGFKNNQAYDRMWEARKIWGGIVNESRSWGMMVDGFISKLFRDQEISSDEIHTIKRRLIYRHIAWLYAHRSQLLVSTSWEHSSQRGIVGRQARYFQKTFGIGLVDDEVTKSELRLYLPENEYERLVGSVNTATQIINEQSRDLRNLREALMIDDFRHMSMEEVLRSLYTLQGKNERIKKFPLPRQYANLSRYFVGIFVALMPFAMIPELLEAKSLGTSLAVVLCTLIAWVFVMMENVGDYSENPFQGMANDIPMMSLCRTIEIDLRQMLGETEIPAPIQATNGILM